jgi:hypothetical protein
MNRDSINTALLAIIATALLLLLWRDLQRPQLLASDIALALSDPSKCTNAIKPAELEPEKSH